MKKSVKTAKTITLSSAALVRMMIGLTVLGGIAIYLIMTNSSVYQTTSHNGEELSCTNGYILSLAYGSKNADGIFQKLTLDVLKDGATNRYEMASALSGSGARFETADKKYSLWEHQGTYTFFEGESPLAACQGIQPDQDRPSLTTKSWTWRGTKYSDSRAAVVPTSADAFQITFAADGTASIKTDCNSMSGAYEVDGDALSFGAFAATKMYCEGSQEVEFAQMLNEVRAYRMNNTGDLSLMLENDIGVMEFR